MPYFSERLSSLSLPVFDREACNDESLLFLLVCSANNANLLHPHQEEIDSNLNSEESTDERVTMIMVD